MSEFVGGGNIGGGPDTLPWKLLDGEQVIPFRLLRELYGWTDDVSDDCGSDECECEPDE
jgi:hypothetical protein